MRYRLYDNSSLLIGVLADRSAFDDAFNGNNPNMPIVGIVKISGKYYVVNDYLEFASDQYAENEFHEIEQDWFANVTVVNDFSN